MEEDRLRIPSTKRICFVGRKLTYEASERETILNQIRYLIGESSENEPDSKRAKVTQDTFVPRPADIQVRNCTRVDKGLVAEIVQLAVNKCLEEENFLELEVTKWNQGREVPLGDLAKLVETEKLKALKSECGGLQTLLRNHNHIFMVRGGTFRLRCLARDEVNPGRSKGNRKTKVKLCWFEQNHPQGCPVNKEDCPYAHGEQDLKQQGQ